MSTNDPRSNYVSSQGLADSRQSRPGKVDENAIPFSLQGEKFRIDPAETDFEARLNSENEAALGHAGLSENFTEADFRQFIFQNGKYFDSYLATEPGRERFWSQGQRGLLSFKRWRNHLIIGGGLIAPENHKTQLVVEFLEYARQNRLSVAFHNIGEHDIPIFQELQFQITKWGEDPIIDLDTCTWRGKDYEWVRRQTNYCIRQGVTACEVHPDRMHPIHWSHLISEVIDVANESLTRKAQKEAMQFFEGRIDNHALGLRRLFIARYKGRIEGFVVCNPILNGKGWATELYRHRLDSVKGTMAFLIHYVLQQLKQEGIQQAGLCLDLGRDLYRLPGDSVLVRQGLQFAEKYMTSIFDFSGLRHFKSRFRPRYEQRFACVYPKVTIGSVLAFASTTGVLNLHYGRLARNVYDQFRKRGLRNNLTHGKCSNKSASSEVHKKTSSIWRRSA